MIRTNYYHKSNATIKDAFETNIEHKIFKFINVTLEVLGILHCATTYNACEGHVPSLGEVDSERKFL